MFEYVKDYGLIFASPLKTQGVINKIVFHMSGSTSTNETVQGIHAYHQSLGHKGIDYNVVVERNGGIAWGRGLGFEGGHVSNSNDKTKGVNATSIGVCCLGDFQKEQMPMSQFQSLKRLVIDIYLYKDDPRFQFTSINQMFTHDGIAGPGYTDCPGKNFPFAELREYIRTYKPPVAEVSPPVETVIEFPIPEVIENPKITYPVYILNAFSPDGKWAESGGANKANQKGE